MYKTRSRSRFESISPKTQESILRLGFTCYDSATEMITEDYEEKIKKEDARHKQDFYEKMEKLKEDHREEMRILRERQDSTVKERISTAVSAIRDEQKNTINTLRESYEQQIDVQGKILKSTVEQLTQNIHSQKEIAEVNTQKLQDSIESLVGASSKSSLRGKVGERLSEEKLREGLPSGSTWDDVHHTGGKGDFHADIPGIGKIVLDIKNHEKGKSVSGRDRHKMVRDVENNKDVVGGILVAIQSKIDGARHMQTFFTSSGKPMVCCVLDSVWERLGDAVELIRAYQRNKVCVSDIDTGISNSEIVSSLKGLKQKMSDQLKNIEKSRDEQIREITEVTILLSKYDPDWNPDLDSWLMAYLTRVPDTEKIPKEERLTISILKDTKGIPQEALSKKTGRDNLRDALKRIGIKVNADETLTNVRFKKSQQTAQGL